MNERKIRVGALINLRGSIFDKQRLDIVKDVAQVEGVQKHRKEISYQVMDRHGGILNAHY